MSRLILVKHSMPEIRSDIPAARWKLSSAGRARCAPLAELLRVHSPSTVITSIEPKAVETGQLIATALDLETGSAEGLHEHDREHVKVVTPEAYRRQIEELFNSPTELTFGSESADQAHQRFSEAIDRLLPGLPDSAVVVTHGTVLSLFVGRRTGTPPVSIWRRLGLPSFVVLDREDWKIVDFVEEVLPAEK